VQIPVFGETIPSYRKIELGENRVLRGTESRYVTYTREVFIAVQLVRVDATFWRVIFLHTHVHALANYVIHLGEIRETGN